MKEFELLIDGTKSKEEVKQEWLELFEEVLSKEIDSLIYNILNDITKKEDKENIIRKYVEGVSINE